jgi:hypothetical protein
MLKNTFTSVTKQLKKAVSSNWSEKKGKQQKSVDQGFRKEFEASEDSY